MIGLYICLKPSRDDKRVRALPAREISARCRWICLFCRVHTSGLKPHTTATYSFRNRFGKTSRNLRVIQFLNKVTLSSYTRADFLSRIDFFFTYTSICIAGRDASPIRDSPNSRHFWRCKKWRASWFPWDSEKWIRLPCKSIFFSRLPVKNSQFTIISQCHHVCRIPLNISLKRRRNKKYILKNKTKSLPI